MGVNRDKPDRWKDDIAASIDFYNEWFLNFAPKTFREARRSATVQVQRVIELTDGLRLFSADMLYRYPEAIHVLRMCTAPPLARDRLIGLAGVRSYLIQKMEKKHEIPPTYDEARVRQELGEVAHVFRRMLDQDVFPWLSETVSPSEQDLYRAATVVADRLTGVISDPIIRNEQERRQLQALSEYLEKKGYREATPLEREDWRSMPVGTYGVRVNVLVTNAMGRQLTVPTDLIIQPKNGRFPLLIEAKSAGDFTNTNKRRKEEAQKYNQLQATYGEDVRYILFLCGYFDSGYLGYEAAEGIDWIWEHRIEDLEGFDL